MKDKSGKFLIPFIPDYESKQNVKNENKENASALNALAAQNTKLENDLLVLQKNHENVVNNLSKARETIEALKSQLRANRPIKSEVSVAEINSYKERLDGLENKIMDRDDTIRELEKGKMIAREGCNRLNKELKESRQKFSQEKASLVKEHKLEVKAWRKELGESNKEIVKLKKELEKKNNEKESKTEPQIVVMEPAVPHLPQVKVFCSICSEPIINTSLVNFLIQHVNNVMTHSRGIMLALILPAPPITFSFRDFPP